MIIKLITLPLFGLVKLIVLLIPDGVILPSYIGSTLDLLSIPLKIFPVDLWILIISNITFWYSVQFGWAIIEWVYKKIPGVD